MSRGPRLTIRARLTLLYTSLFAVCGAIVVAVSYILVARVRTPTLAGAPGSVLALCRSAKRRRDPQLLDKCDAALKQLGAQSQRDLTLSHLLQYSLITLAIVIALAAILGWVVAGRALRPVHRITAAARGASEHNLSARVGLLGPRDELHELAETFDAMLDRLQAAFEGQKRFIANASHELRTPLAAMRATIDVVLDNPDSTPAELRGMAADIRAEVDHAEHLVGALLILARNERGLNVQERVDLATVVEDVLDTTDPEDRHVHTALEPAVVSGDPVLAEHLVSNLVENAIRYNTAAGDIWISTGVVADSTRLTVANTGPVISAADADRIFQPFQRLADRTSHEDPGPAQVRGEHAAEQHPDGAADPRGRAPHTEGDVALTSFAERRDDDRERRRHEQRPAQALQRPGDDQRARRPGEPREQRAEREHGHTGHEQPPASEHIGKPAAQKQCPAEQDRVGGDHPLQALRGEMQVVLDRRQRDVHDRNVEDDDELRRNGDDEYQPLVTHRLLSLCVDSS